ncbi:hypothetical protein NQ318_022044 [Aromia moschata]|uniref:Prostaglandin reductase 1 n=1 Tax=Aromia moschata TaxID=1265417 RepID=A0AAV8Z7G9_9CUCU|nr:hypothetical protein NQ318_022044 [Aromia moschata]
MVKSKVYIFEKQFDGFPKEDDLKLIEEELRPLNEEEFLTEAVYHSIDPYMRSFAPRLNVGTVFIGTQIAKIVESNNPKFPVGRYVLGDFGWRTHTISNGKPIGSSRFPYLLPDFGELPLSYGLGVFGMPGCTAYFGFLEICKPKAGNTVIVTGAAGAVGSIVGQIAKIKGCTVIGVVGSDEKGKWIVDELGYDHYINYKMADLKQALPEVAPKGIDCYFDNVGGEISTTILYHMKPFGRIAVCGCISGYNEKEPKASPVQPPVVSRQLRMEGFSIHRWTDRWSEAISQNRKWTEQGKIKYRETVTNGFENMFSTFVNMLQGGNTGKTIVKA